MPRRYFIRFAGGLAIEVDQSVDPVESYMSGYVRRLGDRWQDVRAVASDAARDRMRVRVVLDREVAEALYRSVPDDVGLLVAARPTS